jgi:hypothetical protein
MAIIRRTQAYAQDGQTAKPDTTPGGALRVVIGSGILLVLLLSAILIVLAGVYGWMANKKLFAPEFALPMLLLGGVVLVLAAIMALTNLYRHIQLQNKQHALGLPEGSIRAIIALILLFLFFIATTFIFSALTQEGPQNTLRGLTPAQFAQIPAMDIVSSTPIPATGTPTSYDVVVQRPLPAPAQDVGKNLVVLLGTLVTAVSSFYFGSKSATSAAAAGAKMHSDGVKAAGTLGSTALPQVSGAVPSQGPQAGGTPVVLTGSGFTGATTVAFGPNLGTSVTATSDTQIAVTTPPGSGTVDVLVTTPAGTSTVNSAARFTYLTTPGPLPQVSGISRDSGPEGGGTPIVVAGSGFTGATTVAFGPSPAVTLNVDSDIQITATTPPGTGSVDILVTTPAGTSAPNPAARFTYLATAAPLPQVTGASPSEGPESGGTSVVVTGSGLTEATTVSFGPVPATDLAVSSDAQITATTPPGNGTVDIQVTTPAGTSAVNDNAKFHYLVPAPPAGEETTH